MRTLSNIYFAKKSKMLFFFFAQNPHHKCLATSLISSTYEVLQPHEELES